MTPATVRWQEPPPARRRRGRRKDVDHARIAEQLRERPGEWARLPVSSTGLAGQISRGDLRAYRPPRTFEAVRRDVAGEITVFVRFVGQGGSSCVA